MNRKKKLKLLRRKCTKPFETLAIYGLLVVVKCFTLRGARRLASVLGSLFIQTPEVKKLVMANLDVAFPKKSHQEKKRIARLSQTNLIMVFVEFLWFYGRAHKIHEKTTYEAGGLEKFKEMKAASGDDKALILLTMHLSNWEITSQSFQLVHPSSLVCVARKIKNDSLEHIMYSGRTELGVDIAHQEGAVRSLMKNLKNKQTVGLLIDQNTKLKEGGIYGDFFGLPTTITKSPSTLARKFKADVCFTHGFRTKDGFEVRLTPLEKSVDEFSGDEEFSAYLLEQMQGFIQEHPELWVWYYKRWDSWPKSHAHLAEKYPFYAKEDRFS
jgi:Kdo2-lipid IVA lauroyltransferase/acyltransferase